MDTDLHDWLMDHRDAQRKSVSDVIREVINFWENCQNGDNLTRSYLDEGKTMKEIKDEVNGIHNRMLMSAKYHDLFESNKWQGLIPAFKIKPDWLIQIIPPFTGAIIRFRISRENFRNRQFISVYLDGYELLGYSGGNPYWEVYPVDGDTWRCAMDDIDGLMEGIEKGLQQIEEENNKEENNGGQSSDT